MSRFQALTNPILDLELETLRQRLGLKSNQKADLLREIAGLAAWVVRQAEQGRTIEARKGSTAETLAHPALERLRARNTQPTPLLLALSQPEALKLAEVLDRGFDPPPALRRALAHLASPTRQPPRLRWRGSGR